jgi:hypothetical protein
MHHSYKDNEAAHRERDINLTLASYGWQMQYLLSQSRTLVVVKRNGHTSLYLLVESGNDSFDNNRQYKDQISAQPCALCFPNSAVLNH